MEFVTSNKGSRKLCYEGYSYTKKKDSKTTTRWECSMRKAHDCKGAITTDIQATRVIQVTSHTHEPDSSAIAALKIRSDIKTSAEANRGKPGQILADKLATCSKEVVVAAGSTESLKRWVRRTKRGAAPTEPNQMVNIPIPLPQEYSRTGQGEPFLLYDNSSLDHRILVFGTKEGLKQLGSADVWFMDGTHSTSPKQFQQLFVIRVPVGSSYITAIYGLLPLKTQETYEEFFTSMLDACLSCDVRPCPSKIICDFEVAIHNAVRTVLAPSIHIQGCFYHLTQSTWRRIQSEGLQADYQNDVSIRDYCGMIDALAFLPAEDVPEGMRYLKENLPESLHGLLDYFDSTYVNGGYRSIVSVSGQLRFRRTTPRFPIPMWNIHDATVNREHRTNNVCESWNNSFQHLVGHTHPSLWTVISCLQKDAAMVDAEILRHASGVQTEKRIKKGRLVHQNRVVALCNSYTTGSMDMPAFLTALGKCIRMK